MDVARKRAVPDEAVLFLSEETVRTMEIRGESRRTTLKFFPNSRNLDATPSLEAKQTKSVKSNVESAEMS